MARFEAVAVCTPGLEDVCRDELGRLGVRVTNTGPGLIEFKASSRQLYASVVWLRTATRVLVRIATFRATDFEHLVARAEEIEWGSWLSPGVAAEFRVTAHKSRLIHTVAIAERLQRLVDAPVTSPDQPRQAFVVRADRDLFTVSADASGQALHHRTWRADQVAAPIRPTMAAALLLAAGWDGSEPLLDPFCGSGTIAIEAALIARNQPADPGRLTGSYPDYALARWPGFELGTWASVAGEAKATARAGTPISIEASDRESSAVSAARANAERAGVGDELELTQRVVSHLPGRTGTGLVATNPPYGRRLSTGNLVPLYRRFGTILRERRPDWRLTLVTPDRRLARAADRRLVPTHRFGHGGLTVELFSRPGGAPVGPQVPRASGDPRPDANSAPAPGGR
jgi:putative N6-adenine-specific DNA methylase